jgi:hypothetical protein
MPWINLTALWQIVVLGLVAGAGLPAIFAIGLLALNMKGSRAQTAGSGSGSGSEASVGGNPVGIAAAGFCFLIVLAAIGWGIWAIWVAGHPK